MSNDKEANEVQITQEWGHRGKKNMGTERSQQRKKIKEGKKKNNGEEEEKSWFVCLFVCVTPGAISYLSRTVPVPSNTAGHIQLAAIFK